MKKGKIKEFIKRHKEDIKIIGAYTTGACVCAGVIYLKCFRNKNVYAVHDNVARWFDDISKVYGMDNLQHFGLALEPTKQTITPEQLGELGKIMMDEFNVSKDAEFTHFIAVGKAK